MEINKKIKNSLKHYPIDYMFLILVAWLLPAVYGLFNRYFIGYMSYESIMTEQSFEALEVLMEVFLEMFPIAVLALVAKRFQDKEKVISIVKTAFIMQASITVIFVVINYIFASQFIDWINTPDVSKNLALKYFRIKAFALPFSSLSALMIIAIKSMKKGWTAIFISFLGVLINYILDAVFISNYSFSLKLGLVGSAWNNVISNMLTLVISITVFLKIIKSDSPKIFSEIESKNIINIGKWIGLESFVRNIGYILGVVAVVNFIGKVEPEAIGGYNTAMWVMWGITLIPVISWTESTQIAIGNAYGSKDISAMKDIQFISTVILFLYMILWLIIGNLFWLPISKWLNQGVSENVAAYSKITFNYLIFPYILFAVGCGLKAVFIGTGRPLYVLIPSAIVNVLIYIPFGLLVKHGKLTANYNFFLKVSIFVFLIDFLITLYFLIKKGYKI